MAQLKTSLFAYNDSGQGFSIAWQDANSWNGDKRVRIERPIASPNTLIFYEYNFAGSLLYTETTTINGNVATFNPPNSQPGGDTFDITTVVVDGTNRGVYTFYEGIANR